MTLRGISIMNYLFSPIESEGQLLEAVTYVHKACHELCLQVTSEYLPVAGNIGIFTHYDQEFQFLAALRQKLTDETVHYNHKYFKLLTPIRIEAQDGVPAATYEYLYIRKPDPYRSQVGDVDFIMDPQKHQVFSQSLLAGEFTKGARRFERVEENMIELWNPDVDVLPYIVTQPMSDTIASSKVASK